MDVREALAEAPYPGRGLAVVRCADGDLALVYWLTGRSEPSRERVLQADGLDLVVRSREGSEATDPLRHYRSARRLAHLDLVGNGDHVDHVAAALEDRAGALEAWWNERPEPDPPLDTARILGVVDRTSEVVYLTAARRGSAGVAEHVALRMAEMPAGRGLMMVTYRGSAAEPEPWAEPIWIATAKTLDEHLAATWEALDRHYRVAIAGRPLSGEVAWTILAS